MNASTTDCIPKHNDNRRFTLGEQAQSFPEHQCTAHDQRQIDQLVGILFSAKHGRIPKLPVLTNVRSSPSHSANAREKYSSPKRMLKNWPLHMTAFTGTSVAYGLLVWSTTSESCSLRADRKEVKGPKPRNSSRGIEGRYTSPPESASAVTLDGKSAA